MEENGTSPGIGRDLDLDLIVRNSEPLGSHTTRSRGGACLRASELGDVFSPLAQVVSAFSEAKLFDAQVAKFDAFHLSCRPSCRLDRTQHPK